MLESLLIGITANFLTAVTKNTIKGLRNIFSEDELKSVLNQAFTDFKESCIEDSGKTDAKILLQIFEDFFSDNRTIREFNLIFEKQSENVDFNLLVVRACPLSLSAVPGDIKDNIDMLCIQGKIVVSSKNRYPAATGNSTNEKINV